MATPAAAPAAPATKTAPEKRAYIVFLKGAPADDHNPVWIQVGTATTTDRDDALDQVVETLDADEQEGTFVAVAARYWQPTEPVVEIKTTRSWK